MPITSDQLKAIKGDYRKLIETGSSIGQGIDAALAAGFETVYSVELSEKYHKLCLHKYEREPRVILFHGDSGDVLSSLVPMFVEPVVFFLDAHKSAPDSAMGRDINPILRELLAIGRSPIKTHTIMVDDFYSLGVMPEEVKAALREINPQYVFEQFDVVQGCGRVDVGGMLVARV